MARPRSQLHDILIHITDDLNPDDPKRIKDAYFQPTMNQEMDYPCITYSWDDTQVNHADDVPYLTKRRYSVIVIDRKPDSLIADRVEGLPLTSFDRRYVVNGLNHTAFQLFF